MRIDENSDERRSLILGGEPVSKDELLSMKRCNLYSLTVCCTCVISVRSWCCTGKNIFEHEINLRVAIRGWPTSLLSCEHSEKERGTKGLREARPPRANRRHRPDLLRRTRRDKLLAAELLPWPIKVRLLQLFPRASAAREVWTPKFSGGDGLELGARESESVEC